MFARRARLRTLGLVLLAAGLLAACAPPSQTGSISRTGPDVPVLTASPTPTPTPTPDPTALVPGGNHNARAASYAYPAAKVHRWLVQGSKAADYPAKKIAFLTFDDGPSNTTTPAALDVLRADGVPASFFYIAGESLDQTDPAVARRTIAEGHAICVHSYSHNYRLLYPGRSADPVAIEKDRQKAVRGIRNVLGPGFDADCFRYPGGHMSWRGMAKADQVLAKKGVSWIDWNVITGDAEPAGRAPTTPAGAVQEVDDTLAMAGRPNVVVVLMHDAKGVTLSTKALPQVIEHLKADGYGFGIIS